MTEAQRPPRVLIRTFPPNTNANYGGILQAWALQRVIERLGAEPRVDSTRARRPRESSVFRLPAGNVGSIFISGLPSASVRAIRKAAVRTLPSRLLPMRWTREVLQQEMDRRVLEFAPARIPLVALLNHRSVASPTVVAEFDAFVTGSDQVWRPDYMNVRSNLFDFIDPDDPRPRFSYAASFGTDAPSFDAALIESSRRLAQEFVAVSVRESSGVRLAREMWGVSAEQHVDPTMLLGASDYARLIAEADDPFPSGRLVDYILDESAQSRAVVDWAARSLSTVSLSLQPQAPRSYREFRRRPAVYRRPSVEAWLGAIGEARFVVTDSFHGTVFSILNNVPFIAVVNRGRGASRFESLLDTFGLRERLVEPGAVVQPNLATDAIDWDAVNARIEHERQRSLEYLRSALGSALETSR